MLLDSSPVLHGQPDPVFRTCCDAIQQSRLMALVGFIVGYSGSYSCHLPALPVMSFLAQSLPLHRELGQSFQRRGFTMQVGNLSVARPPLLIRVGSTRAVDSEPALVVRRMTKAMP